MKEKLLKLEPHLVILLAVILIINLILTTSLNLEVSKKVAEAEEAARPADIELIIIKPNCFDCFDISPIVDSIKSGNVKVNNERTLIKEESSDLINKYGIKKLPSLIVTGEIDKFDLGLQKEGEVLLFKDPEPPYYDIDENAVFGRVSLKLLYDAACDKCVDLSIVIDQFKQIMTISNEEKLTMEQSVDLLEKYNVVKLPTIILSKEASVYNTIMDSWKQIGTIENDGSLVVRDVNPPYLDLATNKVKGLVKLTYITDKTCTTCYNTTSHKQILNNFGVYIDKEETKDVSESSLLISKYDIKKVPTIILSGEASEYPRLTAVWKDVGTIENDGTYVFRETEFMGVSKDLNTGDLIKSQ